MKIHLPPHVAWPAFVVALLLVSIGVSAAVLIATGTDGGAQIVDDYYRKGVDWDATAARREASAALGWTARVAVQSFGAAEGLRTVDVVVHDRDGRLVEGLRGTLHVSRPQFARTVVELPLQASPDVPGLYRQQVPVDDAGLWDFDVVAVRDSVEFIETVRVEVAE